MTQKIVIALGGNALQSEKSDGSADSQRAVAKKTASYIAEISREGYEIGIVHGNGPQVGRILLASETAKDVTPAMPFDVCGAMSQGYIGYHLQQTLREELLKVGRDIPVLSIITQTEVDKNDSAFKNPTKPIGPFYTKEEAEIIQKERHYEMVEDAGRGYRRIVASPIPKNILEVAAVKRLWNVAITISTGGGGIPVVKNEDGTYTGVPAVIDKDFGAELLAEQLEADILLILTEVSKVAINFNKPNQKDLASLNVKEAEQYIKENQFAKGSMLPKVEAALKFVKAEPGKRAIITSLDNAVKALKGEAGTIITY